MLDEEEYADESGDPELAFVRLETKFRAKLHHGLSELDDGSSGHSALYIEYINHTLAACDAFGLDILADYKVPSHQLSAIWDFYRDFVTAVDHFAVKIKIEHANGRRTYSVFLSAGEKEKIRHFVAQIKALIDKSGLDAAKKDDLFSKLNEFLGAVDKDRTGMQAFGEFVTGTARVLGDSAEEAEPLWKWVRLIAGIFGVKLEEQRPSLPRPSRRDQISGPPKRLSPPGGTKGSLGRRPDDDIPF